jgi:hypothetical protein
VEFGKAFSYPFEDQEWLKKLGIAALVMLIPILGQWTVAGWGLEITRRVIQRDPQPLPDWSDFGGHLVRGLKVLVVSLVYALPIILVSACQQGFTIAMQNNNDNTVMTALTALTVCFSCFSVLYGLFLGLVMPAALGKFAATGQMGAAFRFGEVFGLIRAAPAAYLIALLGGLISGFVALLGLIVCIIGVIFTAAYAYAINSHLYGQAYNEAVSAGGAATVQAY